MQNCPLELDNLQVVRKLGQGGQGGVWLAEQHSVSGRVSLLALKTACTQRGRPAHHDAACALHWEANVLDALKEAQVPGVLPLHHAALDAHNNLYLALHFCDRGDLFSRVKLRGGRLSELEAARIVRSLAKTLSCCHALGLMHRDIKPENVFLASKPYTATATLSSVFCFTYTGELVFPSSSEYQGAPSLEDEEEVFLGDFGLAALLPEAGQANLSEIVGTPTYMAPEVSEQEYDQRADIWSLGSLMHALLTGYTPSSTFSNIQLCQEILPEELEAKMASSSMYAHLSNRARHLLVGMLWADPVRRFTLEQVFDHSNYLANQYAQAHHPQLCRGTNNKQQHINLISATQTRNEVPATIHCAPAYAGHQDCADYMHNSLVGDCAAATTACMLGPNALAAH